jgi:hypothetical protein
MEKSNIPNVHPKSPEGRFVVLFHEIPDSPTHGNAIDEVRPNHLQQRGSHWDFMLEHNGALETWALDGPPAPNATRNAIKLASHRLEYLTYEGPVSGDRGVVTQIMAGKYAGPLPSNKADGEFSLKLSWAEPWAGLQTNIQFTRTERPDQKSDLPQQIWEISFGEFARRARLSD